MSTPTEAHRELLRQIHINGTDAIARESSAQLIADSEARAVEKEKTHSATMRDLWERVVVERDQLRADLKASREARDAEQIVLAGARAENCDLCAEVEKLKHQLMCANEEMGLAKDLAKRCELGFQLEKARAEKAEAELAAFRALATRVEPGEHGEGVELPTTPDHLRNYISYLQAEWDVAETELATERARLQQFAKLLARSMVALGAPDHTVAAAIDAAMKEGA